jgi:hypothetical protein
MWIDFVVTAHFTDAALLTPPTLRLWLFQMRVPDSVNMFSDLGHYPRDTVQVRRDDPVPAGVPRDFNTRMADTQRRTTTDYARADPTGSDRYAALSPNPSSPSPNPLHASVSRGSQVCGHGHICTRVGMHVTTRVCRWMNLLTFLLGGRHSQDTAQTHPHRQLDRPSSLPTGIATPSSHGSLDCQVTCPISSSPSTACRGSAL